MDARIETVINYIEDHPDLSFDLESLAKIACLSPSQFHRIFKKETRKTPFQFVEESKREKAYHLIIHHHISIQRVSSDLGYKDYETFSRAFKRIFKFSPDDLKSIFNKLHNTIDNDQEEEIFLTCIEGKNESELLENLKELIIRMGIKQEDLQGSKIFKISKKTPKSVASQMLIKNKYELTEGHKIKESLLK